MLQNLKNDVAAISKMIIVVALVAALAIGSGLYYLSIQNSATLQDSNLTTATPLVSTYPNPLTSKILNADSLKFAVSIIKNDTIQSSYTFYGKNARTNDFIMRVEFVGSTDNTTYVFNYTKQEAWTFSSGNWTDITEMFDTQFSMWDNLWTGFVNTLAAGWVGSGDYSYDSGSSLIRIYDISINPYLENNLFEPN